MRETKAGMSGSHSAPSETIAWCRAVATWIFTSGIRKPTVNATQIFTSRIRLGKHVRISQKMVWKPFCNRKFDSEILQCNPRELCRRHSGSIAQKLLIKYPGNEILLNDQKAFPGVVVSCLVMKLTLSDSYTTLTSCSLTQSNTTKSGYSVRAFFPLLAYM